MKERVYVAKLYFVALIIVIVWLFLTNRLIHIQLLNGKTYLRKSKRQSEQRISLRGKRGNILDRNGVSLAVDISARSLAANPMEIEHPAKVAACLSTLTEKPESLFLRRLKHKGSFVWLVRKLDWKVARRLDSLNLTEIREIEEAKRNYPLGSVAGQLIGGTDVDNRGIEGVEFAFDKYLQSSTGWAISGVDAWGRKLSIFGNSPKGARDGLNVVLTIDSRYQAIAEEELEAAVRRFEAKAATALIMNPKTGEVLAMASVPSYDPNHPASCNPGNRKNRAIRDCFEPGSIFKVVAISAVLEEGLRNPTDLIFCENGKMKLAGGTIHDWHSYGWLTLKDVIKHSSNIGAIKIAQAVGEKRFYHYIRAFGFGTRTGIGLPGEAKGIVHHPSSWSKRSLATIAIGQEISATPLQLATAYCAIANGGYLMKPYVLKAISSKDGKLIKEQSPEVVRKVVSEKTARTVTEILCDVVESGTGVEAKIEGFSVAGKTGTAQKSRQNGRGYDPQKVICSFVGFLPAEEPQLLCLVSIDEPQKNHWAGQVAAPTFNRIISRILSLNDCPIRGKSVTLAVRTDSLISSPLEIQIKNQSRAYENQRDGGHLMPRVTGMSLREAVDLLHRQRIEVKIVGTGVVRRQIPPAGVKVKAGTVCLIEAESGLQ
ncbi:MAG: PASTA domain-containing protein [Candidatus Latescibacteria bacterium]|nr:PASTA domain-containing protein [Candidatus Latescibacterota bacterium]